MRPRIRMGYTWEVERNARYKKLVRVLTVTASACLFVVVVVVSFPAVLAIDLAHERALTLEKGLDQFPVTVDPKRKAIVERAEVNALLESPDSPLQAAALSSGGIAHEIFVWVASAIANSPLYQGLAAVGGSGERFVTITPGMRREQVAAAFGSTMGWSAAQKKVFLTATGGNLLPLPEGSFAPGTYTLDKATTPIMAQAMVNDKFREDVLSHYGTSTAATVPLTQALTIASLIEREASGPDDMRLISGIIWNRLFLGMKLQIDATVQYARANVSPSGGWWPRIYSGTTAGSSAYNTYTHAGLPPGPIASPSVASVLAALNPKNTSCLFYFHDSHGNFHCSDTYAEHVALLKQYYGRGK